MKDLKKTEIIAIVKAAMKSNYGFAPTTEEINLEMWNGSGTYIKFEVNGVGYLFTSDYRNGEENGIWTGKGTVEKSEYNLR